MGRTCCLQKLILTFRQIYVHYMFSPCSSKIRASDKDLPVTRKLFSKQFIKNMFTIDKIKPVYIVLNQTSENVKLEQDIPDDDYFDETIENNMAFNLEINAADKEIVLVYKGGLISESFFLPAQFSKKKGAKSLF